MNLIDYFNVPPAARLHKRIPKTQLQPLSRLSKAKQNKVYADIQEIYLVANLTQETTKIREVIIDEVAYYSIQYFEATLKSKDYIDEIRQELHQLFPNPTILELQFNGNYLFSFAFKRRSKADSSKSVVEEYFDTSIFQLDQEHEKLLTHCNIQNLKVKDLEDLYQQLASNLYSEWTIIYLDEYVSLSRDQISSYLTPLINDHQKVISLNSKMKEDLMMKDRMVLHQEIQYVQKNIDNLIIKIKENSNG